MLARENPAVRWLGVCDIDQDLVDALARDTNADFAGTSHEELLARPEVNAVVVATDENAHVAPVLAAVDHGHALMIEKPLATDPGESERVLSAIEAAGIDAVVGYSQRFRRRFLAARERLRAGQIGEITTVVARAFMNRMVPVATLRRTQQRATLTPMVVSGTHCLDVCMWMLDGLPGKEPVEVYAKAGNRVLGEIGTLDNTLALVTMADGTLFSMNINWALPISWPGSVYGLQIGVVGSDGVLDIEDTHRDTILVSARPQGPGYHPKGYEAGVERHVDFLESYPPGDLHEGVLWGPMREETSTWLNRLVTGRPTPHATAADGHRNLLLTMAMDLSARTGQPVKLPVSPAQLAMN